MASPNSNISTDARWQMMQMGQQDGVPATPLDVFAVNEALKNEPLDPLSMLAVDLQDDRLEIQLEAMRNLDIVAINLGPEQSRTKLLPALEVFCFKTVGAKEEVLRETALQLQASKLDLFGGPEHAGPIITLLQKLAMVEEMVIRQASVDSLLSIMTLLSTTSLRDSLDKKIIPVISKLADGDWWTARASAAQFAARSYKLIQSSQNKSLVQGLITKLAKDDMPIVREKVWTAIPEVLQVMLNSKEFHARTFTSFAGPLLKNMAKEAEERMRQQIIDSVKILIGCKVQSIVDLAADFLTNATKDNNWRVRKKFVERLLDLVDVAPEGFVNDTILPGFCERLADTEPTVRVAAIRKLSAVLSHKKVDVKKSNAIIKIEGIRALVKDDNPDVKEAISESLMKLLMHRPSSEEVKTEAINALKSFHVDEVGSVRINFCKSMPLAQELLGDEQFVETVLPMMFKLQDDQKWRVRCGVFNNICRVVTLSQKPELSEKIKNINEILHKPFRDPVAAVRENAIEKIPDMIDLQGSEWVMANVFNVLCKDLYHTKSKYLLRSVPIKAAAVILAHLNKNPGKLALMDKAAEMVLRGCKDTISNTRMTAIQCLVDWYNKSKPQLWVEKITPMLKTLGNDSDVDVQYLSGQALNLWQSQS